MSTRYYWDSCIWICLINEEEGTATCRAIAEEARKNEDVELWTSSLSLAEVYKKRCDGETKGIAAEEDRKFEDYVLQEFVHEVQVTHDIGVTARTLSRTYGVQKPADAIHLATALWHNCDEFHTFDREDLLKLDGKLMRRDGKPLKICKPSPPPGPMSLFDDNPLAGSW